MSKKHGGHHGGSWKVAYADFVTAMMALFLCLWLTAQDAKVKDAVERAFRNPFSSVTKESTGIIPSKETSDGPKAQGNFQSVSAVEIETMKHISEDLAKLLQQQDEEKTAVKIDLTPDGLRINVFDRSQKPIFEAGTDTFTSYGSWVFSTLAWEISRYTTFKIELEGHTAQGAEGGSPKTEVSDQKPEVRGQRLESAAVAATVRPLTSELRPPISDPWQLSTERANAARRKLLQSGVATAQICKVSGYADSVPMLDFPKDSDANRRVTVLLKLKESTDALVAQKGE